MLEKFVYIEQTKDQLPLLATDFYYINPLVILNTSKHRVEILNNLDNSIKTDLLFGLHSPAPVYPRFNIDSYFYKLQRSPIYSFLPDFQNIRKLNFTDITDATASKMEAKAEHLKKVYLFWSGGIDSTVILTAILKNWKKENLEKLVVVLNNYSIEENQNMYEQYIHDKISTVSTDNFFNGNINFSHDNLYVDGNAADTIASHHMIYEFEKRYPGFALKPWKKHVPILIDFFSKFENKLYGQTMYKKIVRSLVYNRLEVDTIFDFIWWITFNWNHDKHLHCIFWQYTPCFFSNPDLNFKKFMEDNVFQWFNENDYQDWRVSVIGTSELIGKDITEHKLALKKYIFDFNKDQDYYFLKQKEISTPKNKSVSSHIILCGIDTEYNYYYRHTHDKIWPPK